MPDAAELAAARPGASQLTVIRDGVVDIDAAFRGGKDSLFMSFSAFKPMISVLIHQLAERGRLDLDAPVAWVWPEFAARGKHAVTVRHVLQHRSGLDVAPAELAAVAHPRAAARVVERLPLRRPPGARPHYEALSYGVILAEICRRATGRGLGELIDARILAPLGLSGQAFLGLPADVDDRGVRLTGRGVPWRQIAAVASSSRIRRAQIASGGFWCSSRVLATFYDALGSTWAGERVLPDLPPERVRDMASLTFDGVDGGTRLHTRWANGVQLGGAADTFFGSASGSYTFGHNGSNIAIGWHDPKRRVSFALMTSHIWPPRRAVRHFRDVADAVLAE